MKNLLVFIGFCVLLSACHSKYEGLEKKTPFYVSFRNKSKKIVSVFIPKRYNNDELKLIAECVTVDVIDETTQSVYFYLNRKAKKQAWARVYVKDGKAVVVNIIGLSNTQIEELKKKPVTKRGFITVGKWLNDSDKSLIALYADSLKPNLMKLDYIFPDSIVSVALTKRIDYYGQVHYQFDEFESYIEIDKSGDMSMHFPYENEIYFNHF